MSNPKQGYHRHRCHFCGFVWEHHDDNDIQHGDTGAHECPGCRRCNWGLGIYTGDEEPRVRYGIVPKSSVETPTETGKQKEQEEKPEVPEEKPKEVPRAYPRGWCSWEVKIDGVYYPCIVNSHDPHVHKYRTADGQIHEPEDTPNVFGG